MSKGKQAMSKSRKKRSPVRELPTPVTKPAWCLKYGIVKLLKSQGGGYRLSLAEGRRYSFHKLPTEKALRIELSQDLRRVTQNVLLLSETLKHAQETIELLASLLVESKDHVEQRAVFDPEKHRLVIQRRDKSGDHPYSKKDFKPRP